MEERRNGCFANEKIAAVSEIEKMHLTTTHTSL